MSDLGLATTVLRPAGLAHPKTHPVRAVLRAAIDADAPSRERISLRLLFAFGLFGLTLWVVMPLAGVQHVGVSWFGVFVLVYSAVLLVLLRRGWFRPWVPWTNQLVEVSVAPFMLMHISTLAGAEQSFTFPSQLLYGAIVMVSAVRMSPRLSILAGLFSAVAVTGVWWWWRSELPHSELVSLLPIGAPIRAAVLVICGFGAAGVARYMLSRTENALEVARSHDLMGKYVLHERLGEGGMGEVFHASYCPEG